MKRSLVILSSLLMLVSCGEQSKFNETIQLTNSKIFGGEKIGVDHFLGKVTVGLYNHEKDTICTGTIIGEKLILTAAHCTEGAKAEKIDVIFSNKISDFKTAIGLEKYLQHQDYSKEDKKIVNDLAILKLKKSIPSTHKIVDIQKSENLNMMAGDTLHVAGFGKSRVGFFSGGAGTLRATTVKIEFFSAEEDLVVLDQKEERGICSGDSGGGSFTVVDGELVQVGVNSFVLKKENRGKADCKNKAYQASVAKFYPWIAETVEQLN
ncbi:MAG: hypothetical protein OHK0056_14710 [Bacteriovoracaceae bacterium]